MSGEEPRDRASGGVAALLERRAALTPGQVALVVDGVGRIDYRRWAARSRAVALGLRDRLGDGPAAVGIVFAEHDAIDYAVAYFGVLGAGATAVPLSCHLRAAELAAASSRLGLASIIARPGLAADVPVVALEELERAGEAVARPLDVAPARLAQVVYTSGTTGRSKGVGADHANLLAVFEERLSAMERSAAAGDGPPGHFLHALPLASNAGQSMLLAAVADAETTVVQPRFAPVRFAELLEEHAASATLLVPSMAIALLRSGALEARALPYLELIGLTGAATPGAVLAALARAVPHAMLRNFYTTTEAWPAGIAMDYDPARPTSVGCADGPNDVRVVDAEGHDVERGVHGAVLLRMDGVAPREYVDDPGASATVFADGWTRTGDVGYLDAEGYLFLVDREDDSISVGGRNVSSLEVEDALHGHPHVIDAAVVGLPHPTLGQYPAAAVVLDAGADPADVLVDVRSRLAEHAVPKRLMVLDELPMGPNGKVAKGRVRERLLERLADAEPTTPTERLVADVWRRVLGLAHVSCDEHFVDLGGDSLAAAEVLSELERDLATSIPFELLLEAATVAELARAIDALGDGDAHSGMGAACR